MKLLLLFAILLTLDACQNPSRIQAAGDSLLAASIEQADDGTSGSPLSIPRENLDAPDRDASPFIRTIESAAPTLGIKSIVSPLRETQLKTCDILSGLSRSKKCLTLIEATMSDDWFEDYAEDEDELQIDEYDITATPNDFNVSTLFNFIESGAVRIPGFQRNFVWDQVR